jgi:hypothetical protein
MLILLNNKMVGLLFLCIFYVVFLIVFQCSFSDSPSFSVVLVFSLFYYFILFVVDVVVCSVSSCDLQFILLFNFICC